MNYTRDLLKRVLKMLREWRDGGTFGQNEYAQTLMKELVQQEALWSEENAEEGDSHE